MLYANTRGLDAPTTLNIPRHLLANGLRTTFPFLAQILKGLDPHEPDPMLAGQAAALCTLFDSAKDLDPEVFLDVTLWNSVRNEVDEGLQDEETFRELMIQHPSLVDLNRTHQDKDFVAGVCLGWITAMEVAARVQGKQTIADTSSGSQSLADMLDLSQEEALEDDFGIQAEPLVDEPRYSPIPSEIPTRETSLQGPSLHDLRIVITALREQFNCPVRVVPMEDQLFLRIEVTEPMAVDDLVAAQAGIRLLGDWIHMEIHKDMVQARIA